jgi:hypothetical protein
MPAPDAGHPGLQDLGDPLQLILLLLLLLAAQLFASEQVGHVLELLFRGRPAKLRKGSSAQESETYG